MKPLTSIGLGVILALSMTSCNKFLDKNPYSDLVEPDNASKIYQLHQLPHGALLGQSPG